MQPDETQLALPDLVDDGEVLDEAVLSDATRDDDVLPLFDITAYGADYPVDAIVKRFRAGDLIVPQWQRGFVWTQRQAARFIETLLLGLPVPGIFLYQEAGTKRLVVIDGQQRIRSLVAFYNDEFGDKKFRLPEHESSKYQSIHPQFSGKKYKELDESYRRRLDDSILHATIVRQEAPTGDLSIYHIFERINATGSRLTPQEIRSAIYGGSFDELLQELNGNPQWRSIYGAPPSPRLKDQELILRFLALLRDGSEYERPMTDFLNKFMSSHKRASEEWIDERRKEFVQSIIIVHDAIGESAFRPEKTINAAVFDAVMVGLSLRVASGTELEYSSVLDAYNSLLQDRDFQESYQRATSDTQTVKNRLEIATKYFATV